MAKYCCVCKRKLGFMEGGYELGDIASGYILCDNCNAKRLNLQSVRTEAELEMRISEFAVLLNDPSTPSAVAESILELGNRGLKRAGVEGVGQKQKLRKFNGVLPAYEFSVPRLYTFMSTMSYDMKVYAFEDKVHIERYGQTEGLPSEMDVYFKEVTSMLLGESGTRVWISFTLPGAARNNGATPSAVLKNGLIINGIETIPYNDAYSIVMDFKKVPDAKKHYVEIKKLYDLFKESEKNSVYPVAAIHTDSAVDKLKKLKELKDLGILSESEYEEKRQKLMNEI